PFEQEVNPFVGQMYEHRTFFSRLHHFVILSDAFVVVPGGIGTLLEMSLAWQLLQVRKLYNTPLIVVGKMWAELVEWGRRSMLRAVAKAASKRGWECVGILGGYEGLLEPCRTMPLDYQALSGLLTRGGTILGTANRGKFSAKVGHGESRALSKTLLDQVRAGMEALGLSALVSIGGEGTLSIAQRMFEHGVPVVGVPKTIDNDIEGTLFTFGFDSAVS